MAKTWRSMSDCMVRIVLSGPDVRSRADQHAAPRAVGDANRRRAAVAEMCCEHVHGETGSGTHRRNDPGLAGEGVGIAAEVAPVEVEVKPPAVAAGTHRQMLVI